MLKRFIQKLILRMLFTKQHCFYLVRAMDLRKEALKAMLNKDQKEYIDRTVFDLEQKKGDELREDIAIYQSLIDAITKTSPNDKNSIGS